MTELEQIIRECLESKNPILDLSYQYPNAITNSELKLLEECTHLTSLNLTENYQIDISFLPFLTNLTHLNLDEVYPLDFSVLQSLTNLTHLSLSQYEYGFDNEITYDISPLQSLINLTSLNLDTIIVSDISPLKHLINLTNLTLRCNQISDISVLENLTNLTDLYLESDELLDISPLQYLISLKTLDLGYSGVSDISALQYLTNLTDLNLGLTYAQASDISALQYLTNLTTLNLKGSFSDISALQYLMNLISLKLDLRNTHFSDISALQYLTNLTSLHLQGNKISDISALQYLTNLTSLNLQESQVSDISALQYLTNLTSLNLEYNKISDVSALQYLTNLTSLNLQESQILDISALQYLTNLTSLNLQENQILDISVLQYLTNLTSLNLQKNQISDISVLQYLTNLTFLGLGRNQISDISALQYLINLTDLSLWANQISDISVLQYLTNLTSLNLQENQISDISVLQYLTNLTSLNLQENQISDISALQYLTNLTSLNLQENQISDISALQYLTNLTFLGLGRNQISDISALQYLMNLKCLNLGKNQISDISVLQYLTNLTFLGLKNNQISTISDLQPLTNLTNLDLQDNQVSDISLSWLNSFATLRSLELSGNPIKNIPQEIFNETFNLYKMRTFLEDLEKYKGVESKEIKVIFVGNGNVGKTQIAKRLVEKENFVFDSQHNSTHAIVMLRRKSGDFQLNCWDFAGQDLYHATHQLFMQTNALFVLVWDFENENRDFHEWHNTKYENEKLDYWLEYARYFAPKSPILVLQNKIDVFSEDFSLEQKESLKQQYFILDFLGLSAKTNQGFEELEQKLLGIFSENPSFQSPDLPTNWVEVREEMLKLQSNYTKTIEFSEFEAICESKGTQKSAATILGYLHDTGVIYHKQAYFSNKIIINQSWVIEAIYKVLDRESPEFEVLKSQKGVFLYENIGKIWQNYSEEDQKIFMDFMLSAELAFVKKTNQSNNFADKVFIIPQFLPAEKPNEVLAWEWEKENALVLQNVRKTHSFLPKGLIYGFMSYVSYLQELEEITFMWQKGIFFKMKTGEVLVELHEEKNSTTISIKAKTTVLIEKIIKDLGYF